MTKAKDDASFEKGDAVEWNSSGDTVEGTVVKQLTKPTEIKRHHVAASKVNPEFLVRSDETGAEAAHKPGALTKRG